MTPIDVVVINGPGLEVQRITTFDRFGRPMETPGLNTEMPFVFEYAGPAATQLQGAYDEFQATGHMRTITIKVRDLARNEVFRWNLFEFAPTQIAPGTDGRMRYTYTSQLPPNNGVSAELEPDHFPYEDSRNLATDIKVEISGIQTGFYPVAEVDTVNRTITLTFDYREAGDVYRYIRAIAQGADAPRSMSIITETPDGIETFRMNYFEVIPIALQHFTGFGQPEKVKIRLVIAYGFAEVA